MPSLIIHFISTAIFLFFQFDCFPLSTPLWISWFIDTPCRHGHKHPICHNLQKQQPPAQGVMPALSPCLYPISMADFFHFPFQLLHPYPCQWGLLGSWPQPAGPDTSTPNITTTCKSSNHEYNVRNHVLPKFTFHFNV